jgi:hypothetical protein
MIVALVAIHGLVHLLGAANGLGWSEVTALTEPIGVAGGLAWLSAALLVGAAALSLAVRVRGWWLLTAGAAVVSQLLVVTAWSDAKAGTAVNVVMLVAAAYGYASQGPRSFRAEYRRRVSAVLGEPVPGGGVVTEADLATLPAPVAGYLRRCGAVGQPRVANFRARIHGRIRSGPDKPWMRFTGEQVNTFGPHPHRLFLIDATMRGLPVDVFHAFDDGRATMRARLCSVAAILDAAGPDMDRGETVTVFNDLCVFAPAALVDVPVAWQPLDARRVRGTLTVGAQTVTAELVFGADGDLVDFVSDDRLAASADGRTFTRQRWSTPIEAYRQFGPRRVVAAGHGRWHAPAPVGEFAYVDIHVDDITYNTSTAPSPDVSSAGSAGTPGPQAASAATGWADKG